MTVCELLAEIVQRFVIASNSLLPLAIEYFSTKVKPKTKLFMSSEKLVKIDYFLTKSHKICIKTPLCKVFIYTFCLRKAVEVLNYFVFSKNIHQSFPLFFSGSMNTV